MRTTLIALFLPSLAGATSNECLGKPDGTQCKTECTTNGVCMAQKCTGGMAKADGTPCATGDACTIDDTCRMGMCVAGGMRVCPPINCFAVAKCDPVAGCVYVPTGDLAMGDAATDAGADLAVADGALPDGALLDAALFDAPDLEMPAPDFAPPRDLRVSDLGPRDLRMPDLRRDLAMPPTDDLRAPPADLSRDLAGDGGVLRLPERVRGSGCDCALSAPRSTGPFWLALLLLLVCRSSRRVARSHRA